MELSPQQAAAIDKAAAWLKDPGQQVFYLAGYAGTGKTTIAQQLIPDDSSVVFAAYTGKAASVLRRKNCPGATTIHKLIYELILPNEEKLAEMLRKLRKMDPSSTDFNKLQSEYKAEQRPRFQLRDQEALEEFDFVVIDECSMVDEKIGQDLLSFGKKILVLGDPGQLPPVAGAGYFTNREPDHLLTEVHRQAAGNPILNMATVVRKGGRLRPGNYGSSLCIDRRTQEVDPLSFDQLIVGTNKTRKVLNERYRDRKDWTGVNPHAGEKVICLKNNHELGILNGTQWIVQSIEDSPMSLAMRLQPFDAEPLDKALEVVAHPFDTDFQFMPGYERRRREEFDFGYAITCHKSQGSQWKNIYIHDESFIFKEDRAKWLYTALTRAEDRVTVGL